MCLQLSADKVACLHFFFYKQIFSVNNYSYAKWYVAERIASLSIFYNI